MWEVIYGINENNELYDILGTPEFPGPEQVPGCGGAGWRTGDKPRLPGLLGSASPPASFPGRVRPLIA